MVTTPDTSVTYENIWPDKLTFLAFLSIFIWYCSSLLFSPDIVRICVELYQYFCPFIMIFSVLYGYSKFPDFITVRMHYLAWLEQGCRISSHGKEIHVYATILNSTSACPSPSSDLLDHMRILGLVLTKFWDQIWSPGLILIKFKP